MSTSPPKTFAEFVSELYESRFTGQVTLHLFNGVPQAVEMPGPCVQLDVSSKKVDKRKTMPDAVSV